MFLSGCLCLTDGKMLAARLVSCFFVFLLHLDLQHLKDVSIKIIKNETVSTEQLSPAYKIHFAKKISRTFVDLFQYVFNDDDDDD